MNPLVRNESMTTANLFSAYAANFPTHLDAEFLRTDAGEVISYGALIASCARMTGALAALGLEPGDRVTVQCEKHPQIITLYLACLYGGFVFHPLNPAYTDAEVAYFIRDAEPKLIIADAARIASLREQYPSRTVMSLDALSKSADKATAIAQVYPAAPDDLAALLYSSGTTGKPKGIMLTHENLAVNARTLTDAWGFTRDDVLLHTLPLFHVHGLFIALGCVLMSGSRLLFTAKFDAAQALALFPRATVMMGVPTYYTRLLDQPGLSQEACRNIRLFTCGSAPLLAETWQAFKARTGHAVLERYGMTETSVIASNPYHGERRAGSVGPALAGVEVRIADDSDRVVPNGTTGHVQVRSASVFKGYWRKPDKTREDFTADGFFRTGDDGVLDTAGYLTLVGRAKDLIITGGLNVYPSEVEQVVDEAPQVLESAVIGLPHPDFGEQVMAVIVLTRGAEFDEEALRAHVRSQLASFKCPKQYRVVSELPRNAMGKVQKNLLRDVG